MECKETPQDLRLIKLALAYCLQIQDEKHFSSSVIKNCWEYDKCVGKGFGWNIDKKAEEYNMNKLVYYRKYLK